MPWTRHNSSMFGHQSETVALKGTTLCSVLMLKHRVRALGAEEKIPRNQWAGARFNIDRDQSQGTRMHKSKLFGAMASAACLAFGGAALAAGPSAAPDTPFVIAQILPGQPSGVPSAQGGQQNGEDLTDEEKARRKQERAKKEGDKKEGDKQKREDDRAKADADKQTREDDRARAEADKQKREDDRARADADKQKREDDRARAEADKLKREGDRARADADKQKREDDRARAEADKQKREGDRARADADKQKREDDRARAEADKQKREVDRARAEADKLKREGDRARAEADKLKQEADRAEDDKKKREEDRASDEKAREEIFKLKQQADDEYQKAKIEREKQRERAAKFRTERRDYARERRVEDLERKFELLRGQRKERVESGGRIVIEEPDKRSIIRDGEREFITHDETERFRRSSKTVRVEKRRDGGTASIVVRPGGIEIVSIVDDEGRLVKRLRRGRDGREVVLIDNSGVYAPRERRQWWWKPWKRRRPLFDVTVNLPAPVIRIPRSKYVVDYERSRPEDIYEALSAPPVERLSRGYSLEEVRRSFSLRERMRRVDLDAINFEFGSWEVENDQYPKLEWVADALKRVLRRNPDEIFLIEGHTDAVGSDVDNLSLSDRRAESVAVILTDVFNVPPENLVTQGYGEEFLKIDTPYPERRNRRVAVRRIGPLLSSYDDRYRNEDYSRDGGRSPPDDSYRDDSYRDGGRSRDGR